MKLLLVCKHANFGDNLGNLLAKVDPDVDVVRTHSLDEVERALEDSADFSMVLTSMDVDGDLAQLQRLQLLHAQIPFIVFSDPLAFQADKSQALLQALLLGEARGAETVDTTAHANVAAIEPSTEMRAPPIVPRYALTPRQNDVLALIRLGKSNKEIADILEMAEGTVKIHCMAIFRALGVANRTQAAMVAEQLPSERNLSMHAAGE